MDNSLEFSVGKHIGKLRKIHGLTMRNLAERSGLSANAISLIERGKSSPTISSLKRISEALGITINELFEKNPEHSIVHIKYAQGMHIKKPNFETESLGYGLPNQQIEPYRIIIAPGVDTSSKVISHPGQEFVYCISGKINYFIGNQQFNLCTGDSLLFDAQYPHGWCNPNTEKVELLLVFHSLNDSYLAHQRHIQIGMEA